MKKTFEQITELKKETYLKISPFIEIGAERCQRSLVMQNDFRADGAAVDISYDRLKSADYYRKVFKKEKMPVRICCDAYNLPFLNNFVPFIFCYETLHHFLDPSPIVNEFIEFYHLVDIFSLMKSHSREFYISNWLNRRTMCTLKKH